MGPAWIALVELCLLAGGAAGAAAFTRRVAGRIPPGPVLMAAVAAWIVLFGLVPFAGFALLVPRVGSGAATPQGWTAVVLNLVPFALVAAPVIGFVQGLVAPRRQRPPRD
jgi:hypothetical protein